MKKLIIILGLAHTTTISSFAQATATDSIHFSMSGQAIIDSIPRSSGWVSDFENIFSRKEINTLDSMLEKFALKTGFEIAVITVDGSLTTDSAFDSYILKIANVWGIGKKGKDNGMVVGISSEFGRIRIVNGAGVVLHLSDDDTKIIIETIFIANFRNGNYYQGTKDGLLEIMKRLK